MEIVVTLTTLIIAIHAYVHATNNSKYTVTEKLQTSRYNSYKYMNLMKANSNA